MIVQETDYKNLVSVHKMKIKALKERYKNLSPELREKVYGFFDQSLSTGVLQEIKLNGMDSIVDDIKNFSGSYEFSIKHENGQTSKTQVKFKYQISLQPKNVEGPARQNRMGLGDSHITMRYEGRKLRT